MKAEFRNLGKGVIICDTHDVYWQKQTKIQEIVRYIVLTKEAKVYNYSVLKLEGFDKNVRVEKEIKELYGDNLVCLYNVDSDKIV